MGAYPERSPELFERSYLQSLYSPQARQGGRLYLRQAKPLLQDQSAATQRCACQKSQGHTLYPSSPNFGLRDLLRLRPRPSQGFARLQLSPVPELQTFLPPPEGVKAFCLSCFGFKFLTNKSESVILFSYPSNSIK